MRVRRLSLVSDSVWYLVIRHSAVVMRLHNMWVSDGVMVIDDDAYQIRPIVDECCGLIHHDSIVINQIWVLP